MMEKVISNVVYVVGEGKDAEVVYAVMFIGVMDDQFIYAKRTSVITGDEDADPDYMKVAIKDTVDTTKSWYTSRCNGVPYRDIDVPDELGLNDPRIELDPELTDEIRAAIEDAIKAFI